MQFIGNGPDIPDALLEQHEEGRVVFFCGAGISYPAGLPGFKGLVEAIYVRNGTTPTDIEREVFDRGQYDATLDLLERRLPGGRLSVQRALVEALKPRLRRKGATETHAALLKLARSRKDTVRLVTTNFDRVFEAAARRSRQPLTSYSAPMLPVPKNSRWDGLVYLHGRLMDKADDTTLDRLVVTSGDFGLAYLTERWAARFVSELFRNYVVCFVGYSINDPVLRYMMDALAADRMLGEVTPQAWALGDCEPGQEDRTTIEWQAKGVTPILYEARAARHDHSLLHSTLKAWSETYRDGVMGKERIVVSHAMARPSASTRQDDFVGRVLWALTDHSGLPAQRFAEFNPAPSLDWLLEAFVDERYRHGDLSRFGVPPLSEEDAGLRFSLTNRPAPYTLASRMQLVSGGPTASQWDNGMFQISRWLIRHLNDPRLIIWIAQWGAHLHHNLRWQIETRLDHIIRLEHDGKEPELDEIRLKAPNAIPGQLMRTLWGLLLSGQVKDRRHGRDLHRWKGRLQLDGLTTILRLELRELLAPKVLLNRPLRWREENASADQPTRIRQLVGWKLVLAEDHAHLALRDFNDDRWVSALPLLLGDFQQLLLDALGLLRELGEADDRSDRSHWDLPSISPHRQNRGFHDWVSLIELLRDSWLTVKRSDAIRAAKIAHVWFDVPYPTFKRLAFFAASQEGCVAPGRWTTWLGADGGWWLWSIETRREVLRLLVLQGRQLGKRAQQRLETRILAGPPREMYREDLGPDEWQRSIARSVWLILAKMHAAGLVLGETAAARLVTLSNAYPHWTLATDERDEFSHWMTGSGDPDFVDMKEVKIAPRKRGDLVQWLLEPRPDASPLYDDTWREVCHTRFYHSLYALCDLARDHVWPIQRWHDALNVWSGDGLIKRSWHYAAPLVATMPDSVIHGITHTVSWWLQEASKSIASHEAILLNLCRRVLDQPLDATSGVESDGEPIQQPVTAAINHPVGHVTQSLLNLWFKGEPNDDEQLPAEIEPFFTQLCDVQVDRFRHGRVLLGANLIALFRVDRTWTERHLLPLFSWSNSVEAKGAWEGFLWSPRLFQPLLTAFKPQLLESARHYARLGEHAQQFATFLTYVALGPTQGYSLEELRSAFGALPQEGLEASAQALSQALEGAANQREEYWKNRVQPLWQYAWPKARRFVTPRIAESLARLSIAAGSAFPAALTAVFDWLQPIDHQQFVVHPMLESGLCGEFPADALRLLDAVISKQPWPLPELECCLDAIAQGDPKLAHSASFQRLRDLSRRHGI